MNDGKIVSAAEAVRLIRSGDTVATGGFVGIGFAEEVAIALEALHLSGAAGRTAERPDPGLRRAARATAATAASTTSPIPGWSGARSAATGAWCRSCRSSRSTT